MSTSPPGLLLCSQPHCEALVWLQGPGVLLSLCTSTLSAWGAAGRRRVHSSFTRRMHLQALGGNGRELRGTASLQWICRNLSVLNTQPADGGSHEGFLCHFRPHNDLIWGGRESPFSFCMIFSFRTCTCCQSVGF